MYVSNDSQCGGVLPCVYGQGPGAEELPEVGATALLLQHRGHERGNQGQRLGDKHPAVKPLTPDNHQIGYTTV